MPLPGEVGNRSIEQLMLYSDEKTAHAAGQRGHKIALCVHLLGAATA